LNAMFRGATKLNPVYSNSTWRGPGGRPRRALGWCKSSGGAEPDALGPGPDW
jgi:hypothetical protein